MTGHSSPSTPDRTHQPFIRPQPAMGPLRLPFLLSFLAGLFAVAARPSPPQDNRRDRSSPPPILLVPFVIVLSFFGLVICSHCYNHIRRANKPLPAVPREYWRLPPVPRPYWRLPPIPRQYDERLPPLPPDEETSTGLVPPYESLPSRYRDDVTQYPPGSAAAYFAPPPYIPEGETPPPISILDSD